MTEYLNISWPHLLQMLLVPFCILASSLAVGIMFNNLINRRIRDHLILASDSPQYLLIHALRGLPLAWCFGIGLYWTIKSIDISPSLARLFSYILFTIIIFTLTRVIARTLSGLIDLHTQKSNTILPKTSLLNNVMNIIVYAMGGLVVLQYYGISIAPILTALGVGGMAVALGLQETLANIFAGLHLILSKQLRIGDYIRLSTGEEGRVTDITWRFATILSGSDNVIIVPNQKIASAILTNYSMPKQAITISIPVSVSYDSDLEKVEHITLEVAKDVMQRIDHKVDLKPAVRFHTFADSGIKFNVTLHSSEFSNQFLLKHEFIKALMKRYRQEGIVIPFPVRTIIDERTH